MLETNKVSSRTTGYTVSVQIPAVPQDFSATQGWLLPGNQALFTEWRQHSASLHAHSHQSKHHLSNPINQLAKRKKEIQRRKIVFDITGSFDREELLSDTILQAAQTFEEEIAHLQLSSCVSDQFP